MIPKKTIVVQIGNTDNKLSQEYWSCFCDDINTYVKHYGHIHFYGGSRFDAPWQNACWVAEIDEDEIEELKLNITNVRERYNQDSVAVMVGGVEFI